MDRKRTLAYAAIVLFLLFLIVAGLEQGTHLFNFRIVQFESPLYYVVILFLALGAFSMFALLTAFPPRTIPSRVLSTVKAVGKFRTSVSRLHAAEIEMEMGNTSGGIEILGKINPGDSEYWLSRRLLGDFALEQGNLEGAEFHYQESLNAAPSEARGPVLLALAQLCEESGRIEAAHDLYQDAMTSFPDAPEPVLRLRALAVTSGNREEALQWQSQIEERFPDFAKEEQDSWMIGLRYELALQEFERGAVRNAQALVKNILRMTDTFTPAYLLSGEIQEKMDNGSAAMRIWEKGFQATLNPALLQRVSEALLLANLPDRAVEQFQRAVRENPSLPALEFCLGDLYIKLEMSMESLPLFERLHARFPDWLLVAYTLAELYRRAGEYRKATEVYRLVVKLGADVGAWKCYSCNTTYEVYRGRCGDCREWDTLQINTNEAVGMTMDEKNTAYPY